ncbi:MAG: RNA polymerase sigma factor [Candidatus Shapirobacteria bacterium]|jgi:RNA polymerase sigma-70 factor (ECF subfamily)
MTDEEVVALVCSGDKDKFAVIIQRYQDKLFRYIKRLTDRSTADIEDILSDVFISAYTNLLGFDPDKKFGSWIYRIAHNKVIDYFKSQKSTYSLSEDSEELVWNGEQLLEDLEIEKENKKIIKAAVLELELKYKEVILLFYFEGKSYQEISDILHQNPNQVGVLIHRARQKLKQKLGKIYEKKSR